VTAAPAPGHRHADTHAPASSRADHAAHAVVIAREPNPPSLAKPDVDARTCSPRASARAAQARGPSIRTSRSCITRRRRIPRTTSPPPGIEPLELTARLSRRRCARIDDSTRSLNPPIEASDHAISTTRSLSGRVCAGSAATAFATRPELYFGISRRQLAREPAATSETTRRSTCEGSERVWK